MWKHFTSKGEEKVIVERRANLVTALPAVAVDGDEIILTDSLSAPTYAWRLKYVAAKASNKWVFIGGSPMHARVDASESTTSATYAVMTTPGPSLTIPVAGDYDIEAGCFFTNSGSQGGGMSYDLGGTAASDNWSVGGYDSSIGGASRSYRHTGLSASTAITAKYRTATGTFVAARRNLHILPVALGG